MSIGPTATVCSREITVNCPSSISFALAPPIERTSREFMRKTVTLAIQIYFDLCWPSKQYPDSGWSALFNDSFRPLSSLCGHHLVRCNLIKHFTISQYLLVLEPPLSLRPQPITEVGRVAAPTPTAS